MLKFKICVYVVFLLLSKKEYFLDKICFIWCIIVKKYCYLKYILNSLDKGYKKKL